jgi:predicted XRE-type DNA-binding protein
VSALGWRASLGVACGTLVKALRKFEFALMMEPIEFSTWRSLKTLSTNVAISAGITIMNPTTVQITHGSDNVFADLGFAPEIAANLKIRADLMLALREIIQSRAWSIEQASQSLQESPATIENLLQGEIDQFTVEQLIPILTRCGCQINLQVIPVAA